MRTRHVVTFTAFTAGVTAAAALHRRAARRLPVPATATAPAPAPAARLPHPVERVAEQDGVVLPFVRPVAVAPAPELPAGPGRCGDSGGVTKAGAPCAARAAAAGRCHHHRLAA
jgi:hypothetical protein